MNDVLSQIVESILEDDPDSTIPSATITGTIVAFESILYDEIKKLLVAKGFQITE